MYIDTHCHLSLEEDVQDVMRRCKEAKVNQIIISGCDFESIPESIKIAHDMQDIYLALGFHPETASEVTKKAPFPAGGRRRVVCPRSGHICFAPAHPQKSLDTLQQQTNCPFILSYFHRFVNLRF